MEDDRFIDPTLRDEGSAGVGVSHRLWGGPSAEGYRQYSNTEPVDGDASAGGPGPSSSRPPRSRRASLQDRDQAQGTPARKKSKKAERREDGSRKTRQSQSCDACRARKVRCDRPPPGSGIDVPTRDICTNCRNVGLACTFDYKPKKRGPPNLYLRRLQDGPSSHGGKSVSPDQHGRTPPSSRSHSPPPAPLPLLQSSDPPPPPQAPYVPYNLAEPQQVSQPYATTAFANYYAAAGTLAEQQAMRADALTQRPNEPFPEYRWGPTMATSYAPALASSNRIISSITYPPQRAPQQQQQQNDPVLQLQQYPPFPRPPPHASSSAAPTPPTAAHSPRVHNPLDQVVPRALLLHTVDLYFDYLYCLIPIVHRPSFRRDLEAHREERPGGEAWTALVCFLVSATLAQLPRAFVPMMRRSEVLAVVERCWRKGKEYLDKDFTVLTVDRIIMLYIAGFVGLMLGLPNVGHSLWGQAQALSVRMRLNDEESYMACSPIERELRRRAYWLQYGKDMSFAITEGTPIQFTEDNWGDVQLPSLIDDEYIGEEAYGVPPSDRTGLLTGFFYISKLYRLSGRVMDRRRHDRRCTPSGLELQMRINEVDALYEKVMSLMADCPPELRLEEGDGRSVGAYSDDWDVRASADIRSLFLDPKANKGVVKDAFLVQQGNIYVTQQQVRFMILQYRDDLITLQKAESSGGNSMSLVEPTIQPAAARRASSPKVKLKIGELGRYLFSEEEKDQVASDLLRILQRIPIQVIAVNSMPLVHKVRFVASTLLDALTTPPTNQHLDAEAQRLAQKTRRAQAYLWDFLRILSEIEALYSMDDDEPPRL